MKDYRELLVWQKAHKLTLDVYKVTGAFPTGESFGLTSQIRRAVVSIPSNIAEGCGRGSNADFKRFLQIAMGSASEVEYELQLSSDLAYISFEDYDQLYNMVQEVKKMLASLIVKIKN